MSTQYPWGARPDFKNAVRIPLTDKKLVSVLQKRWAELAETIWADDSARQNKLLNICEEMIDELDARQLEGWVHVVDPHYMYSWQLRKAIKALRNMETAFNAA